MAKSTKLKIGFVLDDGLDKPDGVQQYILTLGRYFAEQGHEVHYLVGETRRTDIPNTHSMSKNMGVVFNGNRMSMPLPASKKKIKALLEQEEFDILHVQVPYSPFMGAKVILNAPEETAVVGTFHIAPNSGFVHFCTRLLGLWLQKSLNKFNAMTSVSTAAQDFSASTFGVESFVVPNPVDYNRFAAAKPFKKYVGKTKTILYLGRLVPRKGILTLLEAIKILKDNSKLPAFRVVVCGKGPLLTKVQAYIQEHSLESSVELVGFVDEVEKLSYYASADISVFPSSGGESFGIVLTEAMSAGSVVLAGDNPGYRSVLGVKPELLFDAKSPSALADLLEHYLKDDELTLQTSNWSSEYAKQYDVKVVADQLLETYAKVLRKKS